jgi:hypothetical protein
MSYDSANAGDAPWRTAGEVMDLSPLFGSSGTAVARELAVGKPDGERETVAREGPSYLPLEQQGFYTMRTAGANGANRTIAVNVNAAESDLARLPEADIRSAMVGTEEAPASTAEAPATPADHESSQAVWWYLLVIAAVLLATESIISNRLSRVARA